MVFADWFARWGFVVLSVFFLVLIAAAMFLLPRMRATTPTLSGGTLPTGSERAVVAEVDQDPVYVSISTIPPGATVEIDVDSVGVTPLYLTPLERSVHLLSLELEGYRRVDTLLYDQTADTSSYLFILSPDGSVAQQPDQAEEDPFVEPESPVAQTQTDNSPRDRPQPPRDSPVRQDPTPAANRPTTGSLTVNSVPLGATVLLDGVEIGTTPTSVARVDAGRHSVTVRMNGFQDHRSTIEVVAGESAILQTELEQAMGQLSVLVRPWGKIFIDGKLAKRDTDIEFSTSVSGGEHVVAASHPVLGRITRTVRIQPGGSQRVVFDLNTMSVEESGNQ